MRSVTVTEIIQCPGCSTRYALHAGRVREGLRRAKCFRCGTVFEIWEVVVRLLAEPAPPSPLAEPGPDVWMEPPAALENASEAPAEAPPAAQEEAPVEAWAAAPPQAPWEFHAEPPAETSLDDFAMPALDVAFAAAPAEAPLPVEDSPFADFYHTPPSLTLGDLDGTGHEAPEKPLIIAPPRPEPMRGTYTSAKDAIARLMGDTPNPEASNSPLRASSRESMDVEATLDALDQTLRATTQSIPVGVPAPDETSTSTQKLTIHEIQAAMAAFDARPTPPPPPPQRMPPPPPPLPARMPMPPEPPPTSQGSDLLKVQIDSETLNNVNLDQVTSWIEEGRIKEFHMVARQFSENWIEASKVPALRPVFERKRKDEVGKSLELPPPPPDLIPPKRSLFGGLFGRN